VVCRCTTHSSMRAVRDPIALGRTPDSRLPSKSLCAAPHTMKQATPTTRRHANTDGDTHTHTHLCMTAVVRRACQAAAARKRGMSNQPRRGQRHAHRPTNTDANAYVRARTSPATVSATGRATSHHDAQRQPCMAVACMPVPCSFRRDDRHRYVRRTIQ
jgi:hypothetical protein